MKKKAATSKSGSGKLRVSKETIKDLDAKNEAHDIKGGTIKGATLAVCRGKFCSGFQTQ